MQQQTIIEPYDIIIKHSLQSFIFFKNDIKYYKKLLSSISEIWLKGQYLKGKQRTDLWMHFFSEINEFIFDSNNNQINFYRCLISGALIFSIDSNKVLIFLKLSYLQNLFQMISQSPTSSTILKKCGEKSTIDIKQIPLILEFQNFIKNICPNSDCAYDWSLHEFSFNSTEFTCYRPFLIENSTNNKILDFIIDDDVNGLSEFFLTHSKENNNINQRFTMSDFKLPDLISDCPPYACLCAFFCAEKCFSFICSTFSDGLASEQMRKKDFNGRGLFHFACFGGCMNIVQMIHEANLDLNDYDNNGFNACHYAAMSRNSEILGFLIENGYDIFSYHCPTYMTPFDVACLYGNLSYLMLIDQKVENDIGINFTNCNCQYTPLCLACQNNNADVVEYIIQKIDFADEKKTFTEHVIYSPFISAFENGSIDCIKVLIDNNFDKLLSIEKQNMLLIDAVLFGSLDIVMLISKKRCFNQSICLKALNNAIIENNYDVAEYLIKNRVAATQDESSISELFLNSFGNMKLVKLIDQKLNVPYQTKGELFLHQACNNEDKDMVLFLLNKKCEVNTNIIEICKNTSSEFMQFFTKEIPLLKKNNNELVSQKDINNKLNESKNDNGDQRSIEFHTHHAKTDFLDEADKDFIATLTAKENEQYFSICSHFQQITRLSTSNYYSLIHALSEFCYERDNQRSIHRCALTGVIPTFFETQFEGVKGTIISINNDQLSKILQKTKNAFKMSFLSKFSIKLSIEQVNELLSKNIDLCNKMQSYNRILNGFGYHFKFYFIKNNTNECIHFNLNIFNPLDNLNKNKEKRYPNNIRFIKYWQERNKLKKENSELQFQLTKWKKFINQLQDLINIVKDIFKYDDYLKQNQSLIVSTNEINVVDLTDEEAYDYANILFDDVKKIIYLINENNVNKSKYDLANIVENIYSTNPEQKDIAMKIIKDIVDHKKHQSWQDSNVLKFSFLMKYCSSASYYRLLKFTNNKLPSESTLNKHFSAMVKERERILTSANEIMPLLNQYWDDVKNKVEDYLNEFNNRYSTNLNIENYKINICLGCDAASFTTFSNKKQKNENQNKINEIKKSLTNLKKQKSQFFQHLINGNLDLEFDRNKPNRKDIPDECSGYFFTMLLQPLIWKLPITVIHLSKSINGHFSVNEAEDVENLIRIINSHPHFKCNYFAADGETALDDFHQNAFDSYEEKIEKVINGDISFDEFLNYVEENCFILPILDMLHAEKSGRNRIINNDIKLGKETDVITKEKLIKDLDMNSNVLKDTTSIGRMKDSYPIHLFQIKHALEEFNNNNNASCLYILVYSLLLELFRNSYLEIQFRFDIAKLLFYLLALLYRNINCLPESTGLRKNSNSSNQFVWFQDKISLIKLINTVIGVAQVLRNPETSFYIGMERLSSHPEEQFFGNYRNHFNGNYIPKNAFRFAVRSSLALDFQNDLGVHFEIQKRENYAGAHLNFKDKNGNESDIFTILNNNEIHNNIIEIAFDLFNIGIGEKTKLSEITEIFLNELSKFFEKYKSFRNNAFSTSKGVGILPRIVTNVLNSKKENCIQNLYTPIDQINDYGEFESNLNI